MSAYAKLKRRQKRFVDEYCTGCSGAEASRRSGSKSPRPDDAAYKLLRRPEIKAAIEEKTAEVFAGTGLRHQQIIRELALIGLGNLKSLFDELGELKSITSLTDEEAALIAGIEVEDLFEGSGKERTRIGKLRKIRANDKIRALEALAKIGGLNAPERKEITGKDGESLAAPPPPPVFNISFENGGPGK